MSKKTEGNPYSIQFINNPEEIQPITNHRPIKSEKGQKLTEELEQGQTSLSKSGTIKLIRIENRIERIEKAMDLQNKIKERPHQEPKKNK